MADFIKSQSGTQWHGMKNKISSLERNTEELGVKVSRPEVQLEIKDKQLAAKTKQSEDLIARVNRVLGRIDGDAAQEFIRLWRVEENNL
jgi:hypothetical protein